MKSEHQQSCKNCYCFSVCSLRKIVTDKIMSLQPELKADIESEYSDDDWSEIYHHIYQFTNHLYIKAQQALSLICNKFKLG